ncbi:hypothetical protein K438DRAFT_1983702 [Mycena galopus ATCC 62051]|nr:hypothetical protein K438DRAFT_1983702 [Mycena galopus ATCC 62051]
MSSSFSGTEAGARRSNFEGLRSASRLRTRTPQVQVKIEVGLVTRNEKGKEWQGRVVEQGSSKSAATQIPSIPPREASPVPRQHPLEERDALVRWSLTLDCFEEVYQVGREDFAFALDPSLPVARPLNVEEEAEWRRLWAALLRMDRMFSLPFRDHDALKAHSEEMVAAAAEHVHARRAEPRRRREGFYVPQPI